MTYDNDMYQKCPIEEIGKNKYLFFLQASKGSNDEASKIKNVLDAFPMLGYVC